MHQKFKIEKMIEQSLERHAEFELPKLGITEENSHLTEEVQSQMSIRKIDPISSPNIKIQIERQNTFNSNRNRVSIAPNSG